MMKPIKANLHRILASVMVLVLLLSILPVGVLPVSAATEANPDVMTMLVTDGSAPIAGAKVRIYTTALGDASFDLTKTTGEDGLITLEEITEIALATEEAFPFYYIITAEGYETSVCADVMEQSKATMHIDASLIEKAKATLTVGLIGGTALVTINGEQRGSMTTYVDTDMEVVISPETGYYIASVKIGAANAAAPEKGEAFRCNFALTQDTMILVTLVRQYTVTSNRTEGGVLYLNDVLCDTLVADENSTVSMKVVAEEGYRIDSIFVGDAEIPNVLNLTEYEGTFTLTEDTVITVNFIHIWTVTVTHKGDGTVTVDPSAQGGSVTVLSGTTVKITATPNEGCRVSGVTVNGKADTSVTGENDSDYYKELVADREYTVEVTFAPNVYHVTAKAIGNGSVTAEASSVEYGNSVKIHLAPLDGYTVDTVKVNGQVVTTLVEDADGISFLIENITAHQEIEATFKPIAVADIMYLDIDVSAALRIDTAGKLYVIKDGDAIVFTTTAKKIRIYDSNNNIIAEGNGNTPVRVSTSATVTRVGLHYKDTNEFFSHWHYSNIGPMKIVVDKGDNVTAVLTPAFQPNAYGYYNKDIPFALRAEDTGDYSGIALVEAWVTCDGVKGAVQSVYRYNGGEILSTFSARDALIVDALANSSQDVTLTLRVVDRAGNECITEKALKIGVELPTVTLSITGTQGAASLPGYYNSSRVLTILVKDRPDTFHSESIAQGLKIYRNGEAVTVSADHITWSHNGDLHTGTYTFSQDGEYSWNLTYTNKAGNSPVEIVAPTDCDIYAFTLDTENPYGLSISYEPGFVDTILEGITFGFYRAPVNVVITATDDTAGLESFTYSYTPDGSGNGLNTGMEKVLIPFQELSHDGNRASARFTVPPQFRGKVSFTATDKAGHSATLTDDARVLVVDTIAPGITVEYDDTAAVNESYYSAPRSATIRIEESNFFHEDLDDGNLLLQVTKKLSDGSVREELWKPTFIKDGNSYVAQITFAEDADYTFDITYTDRAGNIFDAYPADSFTVDLCKPEILVSFDNNTAINGNHFMEHRTATVTVIEHNFRASDVLCTVTENGTVSDYYRSYLQKDENWTHNGDTHTASLLFTGGIYTFDVSCTDLAGHGNDTVDYGTSVAPRSFVVDTGAPTALKITYTPAFVTNILETITFGFYKAPVQVTIEATDSTAGVDFFTYSYALQENVSDMNEGKADVVIPSEDITYEGDRAYATFTIPAQFRGNVSFTATDRSGHSAFFADENVVVVDTVAPGITVSYDNLNASNGKYFDADRTATITIEEANFFPQDLEDGLLQIKIGKTDLEGNTTETLAKPTFAKNGDIYTAEILFAENGDYTFDISYTDRAGNVFDSYAADSFTIDKIPPRLTMTYDKTPAVDGYYFKEDVSLLFTVEEHNFRAEDMDLEILATDVTGTENVDLAQKGYEAYLRNQSNWTRNGDVWTASILLDTEGNYRITAMYADLAAQAQVAPAEATLSIDKSTPYDLQISYAPGFVGTILEALTFGFYQAPVTVTLEAKDDFSGIDSFVYSYALQEGVSDINNGKTTVVVHEEDLTIDGKHATYTFTIPPQFRGNVSFKATDKATLESSLAHEQILVIDTVAPGITVSYDNMNALHDSYYDSPRTATIRIEEANFFEQDIEDGLLLITVGKTLNDGTHTVTNPKPTFTKNGDVYTAEITFAEDADYTFDISYTDRSGNVFDSYAEDHFTVDMIKPEILVTYDNNNARNGDQFAANRTATIRITEHNFTPDQVVVNVSANGNSIDSYTQALRNEQSWTKDGDVYTAVISYTEESHYTFDISCTDMAGQWNETVDYSNSVAPTKFTLDKTAPTDLDIQIAEKSVLGNNSVAFDTFYNKTIVIRLSAKFDISGMEAMEYQMVPAVSQYSPNGAWKTYDRDAGIVVSPSEKLVLYFRATDRAGNTTIVNSTGIVVDDQMPTGEVNAPAIDILPSAPNANGIHKGNVTVDLKVLDPKYIGSASNAAGFYSGLKSVTYRIYTADTGAEETGVLMDTTADLLTGAVKDADGLISSWAGSIRIDASRFNSNFVMVEITAEDNAGNVRTTTTKEGAIRIDITAPKIDVSYSNNTADNGTYFKAERVATVTITERNFEPSQVRITLTNRNGSVPQVAGWTRTPSAGNGDNDRWVATIRYSNDGDYQFDIAYTDQAGNAAGEANYGTSVAPKAFTIDRTQPTILVTYDNNEVFNNSYYQKERTATIQITEKNLDPNGADKSRVKITITATQDGSAVTLPTVSSWSSNGTQHTATVSYTADAVYTFDIAVTDKAGNMSADFAQQSFCVDCTAPELTITQVRDGAAYAGEIAPLVTFSDVNFDADQVEITLTSANKGAVTPNGDLTSDKKGGQFLFRNFPMEKEQDDVYTLSAKVTDAAGNTTESTVKFSVNRFGSTYEMDPAVQALNGSYVQTPVDIVITETNVDALNTVQITLFKNNETIILQKGKDFTVEEVSGEDGWYRYIYTIFAENFTDDGVYRISVRSEDKAGNVSENFLDTKDASLSFGVDKTKPTVVVQNLESGSTYAVETLEVLFSASDNLLLDSVAVYLDDMTAPLKTWNAEEIAQLLADRADFTFSVPGDTTEAHTAKFICRDAAGNETEVEVTNFYVTTNILVRYWNNKGLFFGSMGGVLAAVAAVVALLAKKKKKA